MEHGAYPETAQIFWTPAIISRTGKATKLQFCMHMYRLNQNKSPLNMGKVAVSIVKDS